MDGNLQETEAGISYRFQDVSYSANGTKILQSITGTIRKGKITVLVGPSGAGKTTLLKMCNGLLSPSSGEIMLEGKPLSAVPPLSLRRAAGIVLQNSPMTEGTVYDNLALPMKLQGKELAEQQALELLDQVGLERRYINKDSSSLSGGQQQKVSIARTLVNKTKILLLDEITSALDPSSLDDIEQLIAKLNAEQQITIIWITHNLKQARRMGDFAWMMEDGKLVEAGTVDCLDSPGNMFFQKGEL